MSTDDAKDRTAVVNDPAFQRLLSNRSKLRWTFTALLTVSYLGYGMAGLYFPDAVAQPFFGTAMPWVMFLGYLIIGLSIALSIVYVQIVGRMSSAADLASGKD